MLELIALYEHMALHCMRQDAIMTAFTLPLRCSTREAESTDVPERIDISSNSDIEESISNQGVPGLTAHLDGVIRRCAELCGERPRCEYPWGQDRGSDWLLGTE